MSEWQLENAISYGAERLQPLMKWGNAFALLQSIAEVESSYGKFAIPRFEPAYAFGGKYAKGEQLDRLKKWGAWAACSYSSFQIMYPTACELGYDHAPWSRSPGELFNDHIAMMLVVELITKRILARGAVTVAEIGDAFNSGNFKDNIFPANYVSKLTSAYDRWKSVKVTMA